jgi:hypothetical protein
VSELVRDKVECAGKRFLAGLTGLRRIMRFIIIVPETFLFVRFTRENRLYNKLNNTAANIPSKK